MDGKTRVYVFFSYTFVNFLRRVKANYLLFLKKKNLKKKKTSSFPSSSSVVGRFLTACGMCVNLSVFRLSVLCFSEEVGNAKLDCFFEKIPKLIHLNLALTLSE